MTRSALQPVRTSRRVARNLASSPRSGSTAVSTPLSPATRKTLAAIGALWISFAATSSANPSPSKPSSLAPATLTVSSSAPEAQLERGRYIVEGVGLCGDCHTPRTAKGEMDHSRRLAGSALPFQPTVPMPWSPAAPPIAGLPTMNEAQGIVFLTTGQRPDGSTPRPPMPEFRMNQSDAAAVVAYLKSISK